MDQVRQSLITALQWESAHLSFKTATNDLQLEHLGKKVEGISYTIWQLVEHIRIAQKDIVDFSIGEGYEPMNWPDDYWPEEQQPETIKDWQHSLQEIQKDRQRMIDLIKDESNKLFEPIPHGEGQHLFREAVLLIDHEAYHTGQIVTMRKMLKIWA